MATKGIFGLIADDMRQDRMLMAANGLRLNGLLKNIDAHRQNQTYEQVGFAMRSGIDVNFCFSLFDLTHESPLALGDFIAIHGTDILSTYERVCCALNIQIPLSVQLCRGQAHQGYATLRDVEEKKMVPHVDLEMLDVDAAMSNSTVSYSWSPEVVELGKRQAEVKSLIKLPRRVVDAVYVYLLNAPNQLKITHFQFKHKRMSNFATEAWDPTEEN